MAKSSQKITLSKSRDIPFNKLVLTRRPISGTRSSCSIRTAATHCLRTASLAAAGWSPTVENYLGRVTKARILRALCEAKGEQAAQLIGHLKKGEMAESAQELIAGSGWLPEPLRTPGRSVIPRSPAPETPADPPIESSGGESAATGYETAMADPERPANDEAVATEPLADAAE